LIDQILFYILKYRQPIYFMLVVLVNALGVILADREIDKKLAASKPEGEYSYKEVFVILAPASAILTMAILEMAAIQFWASMALALFMGIGFRPLLPELANISQAKIKALLEALFGNYKGGNQT
jgi:hypothetical protein